jgi:nitrogen fixation/metabolism regulation signal transduction histidine kinase
MSEHKRRIRNYLLDRKYQLRYTLIMVVISSLLTAGLGYVWYQQMRVTSRTIEVKALASLSDEDVQRIKDEMSSQDSMRLLVLVGFGVLFAVVVAGYGIILTHKVAGPLYKMSRHMNDVRDGKLGRAVYDLRKGDHLQEFFETFKQMHTTLCKQLEAEISTLDEVIASTERHLAQAPQGAGEMSRHLDALREMRDRKSASLKAT